MIEKEVYEYGLTIGVKNLKIQRGKPLSITLERSGSIYLEYLDDGLLLYQLKDYAFASFGVFWEALTMCHTQEMYPFLVRPVYEKNSGLGFLIKQTETECTVSNISRALLLLKQLHDRLAVVK